MKKRSHPIFEAWRSFPQRGVDFEEEGNFCSPFHSCEMGVRVLQSGTRVPNDGFAAAKHPSKWGRGCEIKKFPLWLCAIHLQTVITSSFQIQIAHRLKRWTPDFPSFLISTLLTFLLILIIQKPILHQNKLKLKH